MMGSDLWTDGLICAFEFVRGCKRPKSWLPTAHQIDGENVQKQVPSHEWNAATDPRLLENSSLDSGLLTEMHHQQIGSLDASFGGENSQLNPLGSMQRSEGRRWVPIGWARISELVQTVKVDVYWSSEHFDFIDEEDDHTVADLAAPYWERPAGPTWWCHVTAGHPSVDAWLRSAYWLHPAISIALRDESRLISDKMKHLLYEVPVRVAGGLLFELLGQSVGDPDVDDDNDIPVVVRSWHAQNYLLTVLHVKGSPSRINVLGITEVQERLSAGGYNMPKTLHELIAHLASRLARWDDRLFRKSIFGAADGLELKFMNRRNDEDLNLFGIILNQEIERLSSQVIRVKWSLHAREEIVYELLQHLRGNTTRTLLEEIRNSTRHMIEEQEEVRSRLFTVQDVMQSTIRATLQDRSLRVTHNIGVFGGVGLVLSYISGLFGINLDGIPGTENTPYAFTVFVASLSFIGIILIALGLLYLGMKKPVTREQVEFRRLELQRLFKMFQHQSETHAQVRTNDSRKRQILEDSDYVVIQ